MTQAEWLISRWEKLKSEGEKMSWDGIIAITKLSLEFPQKEISDEEIEKRLKEVGAMGEWYKMGYIDAIKWYKEKLKSK